ncbi:Neuropeptide receptor A23, partial [Operophtera brumata]
MTTQTGRGTHTLYDVPTGMIVLLSVLYGSISVLAVVGNFLVMWIVATSRRMQSVTNCYIANLALADIRWLLPHFMCSFCPFVQALSVNVSVFTLTAIAVDRHRAIITPLSMFTLTAIAVDRHRAIITPLSAHTSKRVAKVIIVFIWVLALSLAAPMAMSWEVVMEDEQDPGKLIWFINNFGNHSLAIYRLLLYIFQYVIPLFVITFAYVHMSMKLWGSRAPGNALEARDANHMRNKKKEKFKKEFKQRFTFGKKRNRFANDSYEDGQSYRTRILSFRSTNDRSTYSARKSVNMSSVDGMKLGNRNSCHCTQNKENGFDCMKANDKDTRNGKQHMKARIDDRIRGKRKSTPRLSVDEIPIGDERVSELYIFPNSHKVEFTDISYDDKV